ncbi:polymeric immunoglobulin receptor-like [Denticeps clupeoides]|uniref:polymeric immunoglobulin receptor-like n=1 Tax=Denticeps clupeoides TaxID=299321 RepID=UPI0010A3A5E3|nr:polymeric immunoglobulin receptor-like [Denticeps clupeoides]
MEKLLTFALLQISGALSLPQLKGFSGGGLLIKCPYTDKNRSKENQINFCKMGTSSCERSRFALHDYVTDGFFMVLMTNLTTADAGNYSCTVNKSSVLSVKLNVKQEPCCSQPITMTGSLGSSLIITCKYPKESENNCKHLVKYRNFSYIITTKTMTSNSRFSITVVKSARIFNVTINELVSGDAGRYWCGVRTSGGNIALLTEVQLQVSDPNGRATSQSVSSLSTAPPPPPPPPSGSAALFPASAAAAAFMLGTAFVIFHWCRKRRVQACVKSPSSSSSSSHETGHRQVLCADSDYEEIKVTSDPGRTPVTITTIYDTIKLPTILASSPNGTAAPLDSPPSPTGPCPGGAHVHYARVHFRRKADQPATVEENEDVCTHARIWRPGEPQ